MDNFIDSANKTKKIIHIAIFCFFLILFGTLIQTTVLHENIDYTELRNQFLKILKFLAVAIVYLLPSLIVVVRKVDQKSVLILLNVLLGFTVIGWMIALVWSFTIKNTAATSETLVAHNNTRTNNSVPKTLLYIGGLLVISFAAAIFFGVLSDYGVPYVENIGQFSGSIFMLLFLLIGFVIKLVIYLIPFLISMGRNGRSTTLIFVLNFFMGWTVIGWIIALIWAFLSQPNPVPAEPIEKTRSLPITTQSTRRFAYKRRVEKQTN